MNQMPFLTSQLLQSTAPHHSNYSQLLMVVTLVAIFFVNPLTFVSTAGRGGPLGAHHSAGGSMRTLNTLDSPVMVDDGYYHSMDMAIYVGFWILRILVAAVCFGWMTLKSMPKIVANSNDAVKFWRFRKQAENDLMKVRLCYTCTCTCTCTCSMHCMCHTCCMFHVGNMMVI